MAEVEELCDDADDHRSGAGSCSAGTVDELRRRAPAAVHVAAHQRRRRRARPGRRTGRRTAGCAGRQTRASRCRRRRSARCVRHRARAARHRRARAGPPCTLARVVVPRAHRPKRINRRRRLIGPAVDAIRNERVASVSAEGVLTVAGVECSKLDGAVQGASRSRRVRGRPVRFRRRHARAEQRARPTRCSAATVTDSGFAVPLVVLGFAALWVFPVLASIVGGDLFSSEDRYGTWTTVLTRSRSRARAVRRQSADGAGASRRSPSPFWP